jgi:AcrR family transcriptional regulator
VTDPGPTRPAVGVRAEGKARTREKLLDAAAQVFADRGYGAASVEEIARAADVSVGSIYTHFRSKQKLFVALMDRRRVQEMGAAQEYLDGGLTSALDSLDEQVRRLADNRYGALLGAEAWLFAVRDASFGADLAEHNRRLGDDLRPLIATERERRGATWTLSDDEVAQVVLALFTGMVQHRRLDPSAMADDLYSRALTALLDGLDRS